MQLIASHNRDVEQISALLLQINPDQGIHHHPKASAPQGACPRAQPLTRNHRGAARQKPSTSSRGNFAIGIVVHAEASLPQLEPASTSNAEDCREGSDGATGR
jgi:hypothetical protein